MDLNNISGEIIECAIDVHRELGPGLLEKAYEECLVFELRHRGIKFERQKPVDVIYKGQKVNCDFRLDLITEDVVVIEIKAVESISPVHKAQLMTYMKLCDAPLGLILNFNVEMLKDGIVRWRI